ncbi:MAG: PspC domain-containing protein [Marmoricola sp.]
MNETSFDPASAPGAGDPGPSAPGPSAPPHQDLDRLRRSTSDRYVAGVAGGIGRHFGIDPTIIRVLLAVLTFFGGAGVLIYAVCWLFVPEDGKERATISVGSEPRKILLLAAAGVAVLIAMGDAFNGFNAGWPIATVAVLIGVFLIARDKRAERRQRPFTGSTPPLFPTPGTYGDPYAAGYPDAGTSTSTAVGTGAPTYTPPPAPLYSPPAPPAWQPPVGQGPILPPRPKRTGIIWFWPTLALIAIALGIVGIIDSGSTDVAAGVYPAVALAVTGVMLVVGSFVGRPGGLILVGFVTTAALGMATVVGTFHVDGRNLESDPKTSAEVQGEYATHMGRIVLDLTDVADPAALAGREIDLHLNAGEITVIVPKSLNVDVDAQLGFAGGIRIPGYDGGGVQDSAERHLVGTPANLSAPLELDIDVRVGQINVEQR